MNSRFRSLSCVLLAAVPLGASGDAVSTLPPLAGELRALVEVPQPTLEDAKQCIQGLMAAKAGLKIDASVEMDNLIACVKKPFVTEAGFQAQQAAIPKLQEDLAAAQQKLESVRSVAPLDIQGHVNYLFWQLMQNKAGDAIRAAQTKLANASQPKPLLRQLAATNSDIALYMRNGRLDVALALASCLFAVQHREKLVLDFEPALSRWWVAMKKLDPVSRQLEQEKARKELIAWVAMNINARNVTRAGINSATSGLRDDKAFWETLGSAELITAGMQAERQTELMINVCLEVIFFQPQPCDDARQVRLAMQRMLSNEGSERNGPERFGKQAVESALTAVDPKLGGNVAIVGALFSVLQAGYEQARAASRPAPRREDIGGLFYGTGFFITNDGYLVTNHHVVERAVTINVCVGSNKRIPAQLVIQDKKSDLVILKISGQHSCVPIAPAVPVIRLGALVATVGFPNPDVQGFLPKQAKGEIAGLSGIQDDPRDFQISVPIQPGNSGGALVDERGNVVGVVCAILNQNVALATTGTIANSVAYAVKGGLLRDLADSVPGLTEKLASPVTESCRFEDVIASVTNATILIEAQK